MGLSLILTFLFRALNWGVRIALSRVAVVTAFIALVGTAVFSIWEDYESLSDSVVAFLDFLGTSSFNDLLSRWAVNNEFIALIGYALSLDVFLDTIFDFIFSFVITFLIAIVGSVFAVFLYSAPLIADLLSSGLKTQIAKLKL